MYTSPVSFNGNFGYYGKKGPILEDLYLGYNKNLKDSDVIYIRRNGQNNAAVVGNLRALAIQEEHPKYRYMFRDSDVVEEDLSAFDIRKEFEEEELKASIRRNGKIDFTI